MKYNVGDRVRIKSLDWYNENKDEYGYVRCIDSLFTPEHSKYCGCEFTISHITEFRIPSYVMESNGHEWTDEMIECLVEEETKYGTASYSVKPKSNANCSTRERVDELATKIDEELPSGNPYEWECPEGYIFKDENGNVINTTKIVLEKKKKEYPKTYEGCCKVLDIDAYDLVLSIDYRSNKMKHNDWKRLEKLNVLNQILICRDAYWKIYGEEMGLGGPWEPDYDSGVDKFGIVYFDNTIMKTCAIARWERHLNKILEFPTAEMRDAFFENFKELIESCKELL